MAGNAMAGNAPVADWTDEDRAAVSTLFEHNQQGAPSPLDLSDDAHHRVFVRQLERSGVTADRYPQLFASAQEARTMSPLASDPVQVRIPIQTLTGFGSNDGQAYIASGLSSVANNPYVSVATIGLYSETNDPIGTPQTKQSYTGGTDLQVEALGTATAGTEVKTIMTYYWQDQHGQPHPGSIVASTSAGIPSISNQAPKPKSGQARIKLCLGRGGDDCTYIPVGGAGTNVLMPIQGSATFDGAISTNPQDPRFSLITMARPAANAGAGCTIKSTDSFFDDPNTTIAGNTISWNLAPAHFEKASGCLDVNNKAIYTFTLQVTAGGVPGWAFITNAPGTPSPGTLKIPDLYVFWSCLAAGTSVTLADNTPVNIELVESGHLVRSDSAGAVSVVDSTLRGTEEIPMVRLRTEEGHDLLATEGHPIVTPDGVRLAKQLEVGATVTTDQGPAALTFVEREPYDGEVWNLSIGEPQTNLDGPLLETTTFFANGILVGDNQMQFDSNRRFGAAEREVEGCLPPEWRVDFRNAVEDGLVPAVAAGSGGPVGA